MSEHDYQRRKAAAQSLIGSEGSASHGFHGKCQVCNRTFASKATLQQHLKSRKHAYATERSTQTTSKSEIVSEGGVVMAALGGSERKDRSGTTEEDDTVGPADLDPEVCIFCNRRYFTVESAILHMWKQHGFHLPDGEFLVDLHGLLRYCAEKVKIGCMCLYCNGKGKSFLSPRMRNTICKQKVIVSFCMKRAKTCMNFDRFMISVPRTRYSIPDDGIKRRRR